MLPCHTPRITMVNLEAVLFPNQHPSHFDIHPLIKPFVAPKEPDQEQHTLGRNGLNSRALGSAGSTGKGKWC